MTKNHPTTNKVLYLGNDHGGVALRDTVLQAAQSMEFKIVDFGVSSDEESVDYPDYAKKVVDALIQDQTTPQKESFGILLCGSGIGMSIAANRFPEIRAALCHSKMEAQLAREHNNANILCLGARMLDSHVAKEMLEIFLSSTFEGGRHQRRLDKINRYANGE